MNVEPLRHKDMNPKILLQRIQEDVDEFDSLYAIGLAKDGEPIIYSTGDLGKLAYVSLVFHNLALKYLNNEIIQE